MFNKTPVTVVPPGYQPDLDRLPPQGAGGCMRGCMMILVFIIILGGIVVGAIYALSANNQPEIEAVTMVVTQASQQPPFAPTATATMDYCWFLTPTIEAIPTIAVTLDQWQMKATDDSFLTGTPTPTELPTQEPPRAWCNQTPVMEATATWTPYGIPTDIPHLEFEPTETITDTPFPTNTAIPTPVPTSTLFPTLIPRDNTAIQQPQTGSQPVVVIQTVIVVEKVKVKDKVIKVVTATPQPTATVMIPEVTDEPIIPTIEPTLIPTVAATDTLTFTPTETPTFTATYTPTATYTHTPTATYTATLIPTSTLFPTLIPTETETQDNA